MGDFSVDSTSVFVWGSSAHGRPTSTLRPFLEYVHCRDIRAWAEQDKSGYSLGDHCGIWGESSSTPDDPLFFCGFSPKKTPPVAPNVHSKLHDSSGSQSP